MELGAWSKNEKHFNSLPHALCSMLHAHDSWLLDLKIVLSLAPYAQFV